MLLLPRLNSSHYTVVSVSAESYPVFYIHRSNKNHSHILWISLQLLLMKYRNLLIKMIDKLYSIYHLHNDINISLLILKYNLLSNLSQLVMPLTTVPLTKSWYCWSPHFRHTVTFFITVHFLFQTQNLIKVNTLEAF